MNIHSTLRIAVALLTVSLITGCAGMITPQPTPTPVSDGSAVGLKLKRVATGLAFPTDIAHASDGSNRLFITEQHGTVRVIKNGKLLLAPFLDISPQVECCGEQGLLSIAFHPDFAVNGYFFVDYINRDGNTVIARYHSAPDSDKADPDSQKTILTIMQPAPIHNGGQLQFGPDGYLYIGTGDGGSFSQDGDGSGFDLRNRGQRLNTLLGKILRIDVDHGEPYAIPATNPYAHTTDARPEIWALGFKNPWRFAFDRANGDLYISDVGRDRWEEIDVQPHDSPGGENYGWHLMEGPACFYLSHDCNPDGALVLPAIQYSHRQGCAVIGGYVYRGKRIPTLTGDYLYADFCKGKIWGATKDENGVWSSRLLLDSNYMITSFGEDDEGELYITHRDKKNGAVYRLVTARKNN